jgi:hypothetical protein
LCERRAATPSFESLFLRYPRRHIDCVDDFNDLNDFSFIQFLDSVDISAFFAG